jgi:ribonucleoside-diphosphate reductase alpha chain
MEILVDNSGYPTEAISRNSHDYRPLGLGYANLGALLMAMGLPYDSAAGRDLPPRSPPSCAARLICSRPSSPQLPAHGLGHPLTASVERPAAPAPASTSTASRSST